MQQKSIGISIVGSLVCCLFLLTSPLHAQLQLNPYAFQWRPNKELTLSPGNDIADRSLGIGVEALFGAKQLAPFAALAYQHRQYSSEESGDFELDELQFQLGLAWRIRAASTSFNLVPHLALSPGLTLGASQDSNLLPEISDALENSLNLRLKAGITLYLDFISLHYNWFFHLANDPDETSYRHLGIGVRF